MWKLFVLDGNTWYVTEWKKSLKKQLRKKCLHERPMNAFLELLGLV